MKRQAQFDEGGNDGGADDTHREVAALLPWAVAGTLDAGEQAMVERHLQRCAACRADLAWQREFQAAMPAAPALLDPEAALARLLPRLDGASDAVSSPPGQPWWRRPAAPAWLAWLAGAQAVALALLAVLLIAPGRMPHGAPTADYRALGASAPRAGALVVQFTPDASAADIGRILQANGARISDGPTAQGAYVLAVPAGASGQVLQALRRERAVVLAEALEVER
jgi:hypothetical protein